MKLSNVIEAAVEQAALDQDKAMEIAEASLTGEHRAELQRRGLAAEISKQLHRRRHAMHATATKNRERAEAYEAATQRGLTQGAAGIRAIVQDWFAYPLPGGLFLGDADIDALKVAIEMYRAQAAYNTARADFLGSVASRLKSGKTVRESMKSDDIEQIAQGAGVVRVEVAV